MDDFQHVMKVAFNNKQVRHYPPAADARTRSGVIFPEHRPKFDINFSSHTTIFTIGSCFARNIEEALLKKSVVMPTRRFVVPKDE